VDTTRYGALSYSERVQEYPRPQEIAETAHFVGFDGLIVPNARFKCLNVVLFCDRIPPEAAEVVRDHGAIRWDDWRN
jgi:RES domain